MDRLIEAELFAQGREGGSARLIAVHNLAMTRLRRASERPSHLALDDTDEGRLALAPPQENSIRYRDLLAALQQLPDEQRAVLLLVTVEDLSYADAAKVLDIPVGTVMSRLSRARERLLRLMSAEPPAAGNAHPYLRSVK